MQELLQKLMTLTDENTGIRAEITRLEDQKTKNRIDIDIDIDIDILMRKITQGMGGDPIVFKDERTGKFYAVYDDRGGCGPTMTPLTVYTI